MQKLIKEYQFNNCFEYYDMILNSVINGQRTQATEQFKAMKREDRKEFIKYVKDEQRTLISTSDLNKFIDNL
jgi:hypothetical protein